MLPVQMPPASTILKVSECGSRSGTATRFGRLRSMNGTSTEHASPLSFAPQPLIPPAPLGSEWTEFWPLDPSYDFLNHGSFGSVPRPVREAHARYSDLVESRPI